MVVIGLFGDVCLNVGCIVTVDDDCIVNGDGASCDGEGGDDDDTGAYVWGM